jgi:hypothetical protein
MKMSKFFVFVGVLFAISVVVYPSTTSRGKEISLTGIVTGNDVIVSSHFAGRMIRLTVDEGFPVWLRWISYFDPFTYAVHALKALLLKNTGFSGIYSDILILSGFSIVLVSLSVALFERQI